MASNATPSLASLARQINACTATQVVQALLREGGFPADDSDAWAVIQASAGGELVWTTNAVIMPTLILERGGRRVTSTFLPSGHAPAACA